MGGGTGVFLIGSILALNDVGNFFSGKIPNPTAAAVMVLAGGAMMVSSIPFFVASGKNKSKAKLLLKEEAGNNILYKFNYPAIGFVVKL